ncbi:MAG: restriction endonuclease subunit S [Crocinitomicaceae bacterium]|nr:restriction endonuclease subunit S [Crocinitomicaceae bacterium]
MNWIELLKAAPFSGQKVKPFDGHKKYLATGSLVGDDINFEEVTYQNKPSRASIEVSQGDIIFAKMKDTNKVLLVDESLSGIIVSSGFSVHKCGKNLNPVYFKHLLEHNIFLRQKDKYCTGAIQPAITNTGLKKIKIPLPALIVQNSIAKILSDCENVIQKRKESIDLLDNYLKSKFFEMFGELTSKENTWPIKTLESICEKIVDCPHDTPTYSEQKTGYYCVRSSDIQNGEIVLSAIRNVSKAVYQERTKRHIPNVGEVVFTREGGRFGNAGRIPTEERICLGQRMMLFRAKEGLSTNNFIWALISSERMQRLFKKMSKGGAAPRVNISDLKKIKLSIPDYSLQLEFDFVVNTVDQVKSTMQTSLNEIENLYDSLSQSAFNGELNLNRVESNDVEA